MTWTKPDNDKHNTVLMFWDVHWANEPCSATVQSKPALHSNIIFYLLICGITFIPITGTNKGNITADIHISLEIPLKQMEVLNMHTTD